MLQAVHEKKGSAKASSLYCQWICVERAGETCLVAVWIDSEMRAFARESAIENRLGRCVEEGMEEVEQGNAE
jgi:hypothetical protein